MIIAAARTGILPRLVRTPMNPLLDVHATNSTNFHLSRLFDLPRISTGTIRHALLTTILSWNFGGKSHQQQWPPLRSVSKSWNGKKCIKSSTGLGEGWDGRASSWANFWNLHEGTSHEQPWPDLLSWYLMKSRTGHVCMTTKWENVKMRKCRKYCTLHLGRDDIEQHFLKLTPETPTELDSNLENKCRMRGRVQQLCKEPLHSCCTQTAGVCCASVVPCKGARSQWQRNASVSNQPLIRKPYLCVKTRSVDVCVYYGDTQALGTYKVQAFLLVLSKWLKLYIEHENVRTIPAWQVVAPESCKSSQSFAISSSISSRSWTGLVQLGQHCFQLGQGQVVRQFSWATRK